MKAALNVGMAILLFIALLVSFLIIVGALQNSARFEHFYSILLLINAMALLALLALIFLNLQQLISQVHKKRIGARLTVRLVSLLVLLSTVPVIIVYYFSLEFLHQRLDKWFDPNMKLALTDALNLSQAALDARMREALKRTTRVAEEIARLDDEMITMQFNELGNNSDADELTLLTANGHIIASVSADIEYLLPNRPNEGVLLQLKQSDNYISLENIADRGLHIRVVIKLTQNKPVRLLQALFPIDARIRELAENVEVAFANYKERAYLQQPLKLSFTVVLSLILLLCIFSAVLMAFFTARRFIAPLSHLVEGTIAVANGNYEKKLPVIHSDELGFLVQSFNQMTDKIAQARDEVKQSQQLAESQRAYFEAVLERLSSGVISLDHQYCLRTANPAAEKILGLPFSQLLGQSVTQLQNGFPTLQPLCSAILPYLINEVQDWREEMTLFGAEGRKILVCRGTPLQQSHTQKQQEGYVIVFEDVTTLVQAQRDAAWSEVARRLAHEIKNPLTPIQLSAERLRYKYLRQLPAKDAETLNRMTHTIIQQVDAMKGMVNAFSDYAKTPSIDRQPLNFNQLIKEVLELYHHTPVLINTKLDDSLPVIKADSGCLRQVLHNLIKNALEAKSTDNCITVTTRYLTESCFKCVELRLSDKGPGIPEPLFDKIFEPYVTTKTKGTGLGLAIVKKMIDEHNGAVWIEQIEGTCIVIRLPVVGGCNSYLPR
jgi:PAS domain S-box-containing protein